MTIQEVPKKIKQVFDLRDLLDVKAAKIQGRMSQLAQQDDSTGLHQEEADEYEELESEQWAMVELVELLESIIDDVAA